MGGEAIEKWKDFILKSKELTLLRQHRRSIDD